MRQVRSVLNSIFCGRRTNHIPTVFMYSKQSTFKRFICGGILMFYRLICLLGMWLRLLTQAICHLQWHAYFFVRYYRCYSFAQTSLAKPQPVTANSLATLAASLRNITINRDKVFRCEISHFLIVY